MLRLKLRDRVGQCRLPIPDNYFHFARGFATLALAHKLDSLVRVSRRDGEKRHLWNTIRNHKSVARALRSFELKTAKTSFQEWLANTYSIRTTTWRVGAEVYLQVSETTKSRQRELLDHRDYLLTFQRFQFLLTLFSKSFSSFPHGTCMLSESH